MFFLLLVGSVWFERSIFWFSLVNKIIEVFVVKLAQLSFGGKSRVNVSTFKHYFLTFMVYVLLASYIVYECRTVRSSAALALGKLSVLSTRVDPLVGDLLSSLQVRIFIL